MNFSKQKSKLLYAIDDITQMENEGQRYKAMFVLWDIAQRMRVNELTTSANQAEILAEYGIILTNGKITDWGNTDADTWKKMLIATGGLIVNQNINATT